MKEASNFTMEGFRYMKLNGLDDRNIKFPTCTSLLHVEFGVLDVSNHMGLMKETYHFPPEFNAAPLKALDI